MIPVKRLLGMTKAVYFKEQWPWSIGKKFTSLPPQSYCYFQTPLFSPFVTEAFKTKLENFSKELCFDYQDFEASELNLDVYC